MDTTQLRAELAAQISQAKSLAESFKGRETEMPKDVEDRIAAHYGKADELKTRLDVFNRGNDLERYMSEPATEPVGNIGWRPAAPNEGDAPVDAQSWREVKVRTVFGEQTVRFNVPIAAEKKGYASALRAYLTKGINNMGPTDYKTLIEGTDTAGGFLVDEDWQTQVIKKLAMRAAVRSLCRVVQTNSQVIQWPRVNYASGTNDTNGKIFTSGARISWVGEQPASATTANVTDPVFGQISIPVNTAMARMPISNDLLEDASFDVAGYGSDILGEAFALDEDNVFLNGTGNGRPIGLLTEVDGNGPTSQASGTSAAITTSSDAHGGVRLNDVYYNTPAQYRGQGAWMMTSLTLEAMDNLVDGQKRPILREMSTGGMMQGEPVVLKGKPVIVDEFVPEIAASSLSVIFGDFGGYTIVDRVAMSIQRLTELYAETNLTVLLARRRVGGYCTEPYKFRVLKCA